MPLMPVNAASIAAVKSPCVAHGAVPRRIDCFFLILFSFFFFSSPLLSSPFSLCLLVVTQIRGHIAASSSPLPTTVRALHFYRKKISALSSLVDSRRIVPTHARRSQQLILSFCKKNQTPGPTLIKIVAFEGNH